MEKAVGYVLSDSYKAYYRAADGAKVVWAGPSGSGGFDLLPLREVFLGRIGYIFGFDNVERGERTEPAFGGVDEHVLRRLLRRFDAARIDGNSYPTVALVGSSSFPDPALIFPDDACAALSDAHPMLATCYLEMLLATGGHERAADLFTRRGFAGSHALLAWTPADWTTLGGVRTFLAWQADVGTKRADDRALKAAFQAGETPAVIGPRRWLELRFGATYAA